MKRSGHLLLRWGVGALALVGSGMTAFADVPEPDDVIRVIVQGDPKAQALLTPSRLQQQLKSRAQIEIVPLAEAAPRLVKALRSGKVSPFRLEW